MVKRFKIKVYAFLIKTIGKLSQGIRIASKYGLTSGKMLEYVYDNKPEGYFFIGKWIDRIYLNHPDWEAVRERKNNVKFYIKEAILNNRKKGISTRILDIAAGYARYIREALCEVGADDVEVVCVDLEEKYVKEVKEKFKKYNINISYKQGNAFDKKFLSSFPSFNVIISSGFYDWIIEDRDVLRSIEIVYSILQEDGVFILTGQARHPNLELVSHAFVDFKKQPLKMKMRKPELMIKFLKEKGFSDTEIKVDKWGYYYTIRGRK